MSDKLLVKIFARCFRQIAKLSATTDDKFFVDLLNEGSEKLLEQYIIFLRCEGTVNDGAHVAQYEAKLVYQIKNILSLLNILKHLVLKEPIAPLLLERDLLLLESAIFNNHLGKKVNSKIDKQNLKPEKNQINSQTFPDFLGFAHKQIAQFVASRERVQNIEVFAKFSDIAKRTLKRKLSELVEASVIKRTATGKKVFYAVPAVPSRNPV